MPTPPTPQWWETPPEEVCQYPADYTTRTEDHINWHLHKVEYLLKQTVCALLEINKKLK